MDAQGNHRQAVAENRTAFGGDQRIELRRVECHLTESLMKRLLRKVFPDQRKHSRIVVPPLVGYLGTGRGFKAFEVGDISQSGFCLLTEERWTPGTEMPITLQRTSLPDETNDEYFTVQATVVRCGNDGVGFSIVLCEDESQAAYGNPLKVRWITTADMDMFLNRLHQPTPEQLETPHPESSSSGREFSPAFQSR